MKKPRSHADEIWDKIDFLDAQARQNWREGVLRRSRQLACTVGIDFDRLLNAGKTFEEALGIVLDKYQPTVGGHEFAVKCRELRGEE